MLFQELLGVISLSHFLFRLLVVALIFLNIRGSLAMSLFYPLDIIYTHQQVCIFIDQATFEKKIPKKLSKDTDLLQYVS